MIQIENFQVFPQCIGDWQGKWIALDPNGRELYRFTSLLKQRIIDNRWVQTNENSYSDGRQEILHFEGTAVKQGTLLLESPDSPYDRFVMLAEEQGDNLIIISVSERTTGLLLATETINLVSKIERIRTLQQFKSTEGKLRGFTLVIEKKLADGADERSRQAGDNFP
ncbi:DUF3598 family protein [Oscillatoria salina]|uniref:DUF3598 family protein n=1 Tax=Oscillatoria salina TaxID=331517 RepID=UPI0013B8DA4A|nr:DUF3598 family protein [Oscillatoria salina]MBZ8183328.1 hypothetical protein [Oscillatoria salina IIICB1]NET87242.1 hypothetical protein [Kamptonema sp. SIO1D9]